MGMEEWAEREVEIACARERKNSTEKGEWNYGCACYHSALKAYKSLMEDDHSGYSIDLTKHVLVRLIDGKPLTPIEDTDDAWDEPYSYRGSRGDYRGYQSKRMSSLFKNVYDDGSVIYSDIDRYYCVDIDNPNNTYRLGLVGSIVDEMFPISMPYYPSTTPFKIYCSEFLTDEANGDFDTVGVHYLIKPDGEKVQINRYYKEDKGLFIEISLTEYLMRKKTIAKAGE